MVELTFVKRKKFNIRTPDFAYTKKDIEKSYYDIFMHLTVWEHHIILCSSVYYSMKISVTAASNKCTLITILYFNQACSVN
jgi:hypothetical protein